MNFQRARSTEEKQIRMNQLKKAATKLFDTCIYQDITLSKIGNEIDFTRANLYRYVSTKEDIYLQVLIDELNLLVEDMNAKLHLAEPLSPHDFSYGWATILAHHTRCMKLLALLFTMIEQNATLDALVDFKNDLQEVKISMYAIIRHNLRALSHAGALKLLDYAFSFVVARYPFSYPHQKQIQATELSSSQYVFPLFEETFSELLRFTIEGLSKQG